MTTPFLRRTGYAFVCLFVSLSLASCDFINKQDEENNVEENEPNSTEATLGTEGGMVRSADGNIDFVIPPGTLERQTRVRVTTIPIADFHDEVVRRGIEPVGEPLDRAGLLEIEADAMQLPAFMEVATPAGVSATDEVIFTQLLPDQLRYLGAGSFSEDGTRIRVSIPINAEQGLPGASGSSGAKNQRQFSFLGEVQGNGIDDDGDGLVDEIEMFFYPDRAGFNTGTGLCQVTGAVTFSNGVPVAGAVVRVLGADATTVVDIADAFGRYVLPLFVGGFSSFTVNATAPTTGQVGTAAGACSVGSTGVQNVTISTSAPPSILVNITSPADEAILTTNVPTITGTVNDRSVTEVQILINGQYPSVVGHVRNGTFSVQVFLGFSTNSILVLARNQQGQTAVKPITAHVTGNTTAPPDLQVSLQWDKNNDLDFYLVTPAGGLIWFVNKRADGGSLNIDQMSGTASGPEVISFPAGTAQPGRYGIAVEFYSEDGLGASKATVSLFVKGRSLGTFEHVLTVSDNLASTSTLADLNPASVWNVTSVDLPAGTLAPVRSLSDFSLSGGSASKRK